MSLGIWNLQWLNHNSQRSYPILDACSKQCADDPNIVIPDDVILAINLATHSGLAININDFYIKSMVLYSTGCTIMIGYNNEVAAVTHIQYDSDEIQTAILVGTGSFSDTVGYIAVNTKSAFLRTAYCEYNFNVDATRLEIDCIRPMIRSISSLTVSSAGTTSDKIYGDIVLAAGANIALSSSRSAGSTTITISAMNQDYTDECVCTDNAEQPCIKTINGIPPDGSGNFSITGTACAQVSGGSTVNINDTCAEPCCGCEELNALSEEIEKFADGKITLETFLAQLLGAFSAIQTVLLGSK